jgi:hypothetical protein
MSTLNLILLSLHSVARWVVILFALIVIIRGLTGWFGKRRFNAADNRYSLFYTVTFDIQLLLGLILYFTKGWAGVLAGDFAAAMRNSGTRFFAVEHLVLMLIALAVAHIGRSVSKKGATDLSKHRRAVLWYTVSFVLLIAAIPWPFMSYGRPLLRLFGLEL